MEESSCKNLKLKKVKQVLLNKRNLNATIKPLAAQKFVSDVASDALANCKMRQSNTATNNKKEKKYALTTEDLAVALGDHGVNVRKPPYYQ